MNIHIITSSYPAHPDDPSGTAGLCVRQFALELAGRGHSVVVQPAGRKKSYLPDTGVSVVPAPWSGGDQELASMNLMNPANWGIFLLFFLRGAINTRRINRKYKIERMLCAWAVPSGILGLAGKIRCGIPYDIWALGSDIWKIGKIPLFGKLMLKMILKNADRVYADGFQLCRDVEELTGVRCKFLPSSRKLPPPQKKLFPPDSAVTHLLFVGRYHINKGPDLLISAIACLPDEVKEQLRVHMFGLGPLKQDLEKNIAASGLVKYIELQGPIQAQPFSDFLNSVSFLVIPSRIESFPIVLSDALQAGTPVISMPVGDLESFIKKYKCGVVAEEPTPRALAAAIQAAVLQGKNYFSENTARAYQLFDMGQAIEQWLDFDPVQFHPVCGTSGE